MNKPVSDLTYKIVALLDMGTVNLDDSVDWAIEMMELGYESPSLYMLAGFSKPTTHFEIVNYLKNTITELGLEIKHGDEATVSYASYYISQISKEKNIRESLSELYKLCLLRDYSNSLVMNFYLLYWAWDAIDYDETGVNHYWEGATKNNIKAVVIGEANKWIKKYMPQIMIGKGLDD
jgi:hypothetical protein